MDLSQISTQELLLALFAGIVPAFLWLWFWLREDRLHPEPKTMIALAFIGGMFATLLSYPIERSIAGYLTTNDGMMFASTLAAFFGFTEAGVQDVQFVLWVVVEEVLKYAALALLVLRSPYFDEPIDAVIYMITIAVGFSGLENALFLLNPISHGDTQTAMNLAALRFIGASLLHITSSAILGAILALTYFRSHPHRITYTLIGLLGAVGFHATYNLSLMNSVPGEISSVFIGLWIAAMGILIACERIRRMPMASHIHNPTPLTIEHVTQTH